MLDTVLAHIQDQPPWLTYTEDIALIDENPLTLEHKVNLWKSTLENGDFKLNISKIEYKACRSPDSNAIHIGPEPAITTVPWIRYARVWRHRSHRYQWPGKRCLCQMAVTMVCDYRISPRLKGLIYKSNIRPVLLYGSEC